MDPFGVTTSPSQTRSLFTSVQVDRITLKTSTHPFSPLILSLFHYSKNDRLFILDCKTIEISFLALVLLKSYEIEFIMHNGKKCLWQCKLFKYTLMFRHLKKEVSFSKETLSKFFLMFFVVLAVCSSRWKRFHVDEQQLQCIIVNVV